MPVVNLRANVSRPRADADYFTKQTRARLREGHRSAAWEKLLETVQPDPEFRAFVQRCFGAGLSGLGGERLVFAIYGPPGSGKSTVTSVVSNAMGNYAATLRPDALALKQYAGQGHTSELIPLVGARMAFVHELPEKMELNSALLKTIVGGEEFSVSEKGKPHFTTRFVAKLYLVSNHPITMSATDDAAWARLQLVPFLHPIPDPNRDLVRLLAEDQDVLDACLGWLVEGWKDYRAGGLRPPAAIVQMAQEQREQNTVISEWLAARVERGAELAMPSEKAYRDCRDFLTASGRLTGLDLRRFAREMAAAGFAKAKRKDGAYWLGGQLTEVRAAL